MPEELSKAIPVLWPSMLAAGVLLLMAWWPRWKREGAAVAPTRRGGWAGALAFGSAFAAAMLVVTRGLPAFPFRERWHWLLAICGGATLFGLIAGLFGRGLALRLIFGVAAAACAGWLLSPPPSIEQPLMVRGAVAVAALVMWWCIDGSSRRYRGFSTPLLLAIVFTATSMALVRGGNANFSLLAASVAAALGVAMVIALLLPPLSLADGSSYVLAALLAALLALGWMYGASGRWAMALLALAPVCLRAGELLLLRRESGSLKSLLVRGVCVLAPVAAAVIVAIADSQSSGDDYGY